MFGEETEYGSRRGARRHVRLEFDGIPVEFRKFQLAAVAEMCGEFRIPLRPEFEFLTAASYGLPQPGGALRIEFGHLGTDHPGVFRIAAPSADGCVQIGTCGGKGLAVGIDGSLHRGAVGADHTAGHHCMADDERGTFLLIDSGLQGCRDCKRIAAVDLKDIPAPCAVLGGDILMVHLLYLGGELDFVGVIEHDEIVESEQSCDTARALRDLLLNTTVGDKSISLVGHHFAEACGKEALGYGAADGHDMTLAQRA